VGKRKIEQQNVEGCSKPLSFTFQNLHTYQIWCFLPRIQQNKLILWDMHNTIQAPAHWKAHPCSICTYAMHNTVRLEGGEIYSVKIPKDREAASL
jgi:hypothetical protein